MTPADPTSNFDADNALMTKDELTKLANSVENILPDDKVSRELLEGLLRETDLLCL